MAKVDVTDFGINSLFCNRIQTGLPTLTRNLPAQKLGPPFQNLLEIVDFTLVLPSHIQNGAVLHPAGRANPHEQRHEPRVSQKRLRFQSEIRLPQELSSFIGR
ncbi:bacteriohemerythrin [Striga asiatica]|uniref:Bacteriohemerythrin n=1 Tax=Striga asiatica TaxID=4170 RepID=A0A5A7QGB3_STRAF|nr:bacteriohemerythrin [Striga asiatica]